MTDMKPGWYPFKHKKWPDIIVRYFAGDMVALFPGSRSNMKLSEYSNHWTIGGRIPDDVIRFPLPELTASEEAIVERIAAYFDRTRNNLTAQMIRDGDWRKDGAK
jgi:hypothetical protein